MAEMCGCSLKNGTQKLSKLITKGRLTNLMKYETVLELTPMRECARGSVLKYLAT